jgi:hypothetical protein
MTTPARVEANRRNAQLSTGPRTSEGKAASRLNALRHGLRARDPLLPGERVEEYEALLAELHRELQPVGLIEAVLVTRIADRIWRLARILRMETGILLWLFHSPADSRRLSREPEDFVDLLTRLRDDGSSPAADAESGRTESDDVLQDEMVQLGKAVVRDASEADTLSKLSRYETRLDRGLIRDVRELERLQQSRRSSGRRPEGARGADRDEVSPLELSH